MPPLTGTSTTPNPFYGNGSANPNVALGGYQEGQDTGGVLGGPSTGEMAQIGHETPVDAIQQGAYQLAGPDKQRFDQAQLSLAKSYQDTLSGRGPSVAQTQLGMGQDAAMRQLQSSVASHRGMNAGLARRSLLNAQSNMLGQQNGQAALLRANEVNMARQGYGDMAGRDLSAAGMNTQAAMQYQQDRAQQQQHMYDLNYQRRSGQSTQGLQLATAGIAAGGAIAAHAAAK